MSEKKQKYKKGSYAPIKLCRKYIYEAEANCCVHCQWFHQVEPAVVFQGPTEFVANLTGECHRNPPQVASFEDPLGIFPIIDGNSYCGEFKASPVTAEEICWFTTQKTKPAK